MKRRSCVQMSSWADKGWMRSKELIRHCSGDSTRIHVCLTTAGVVAKSGSCSVLRFFPGAFEWFYFCQTLWLTPHLCTMFVLIYCGLFILQKELSPELFPLTSRNDTQRWGLSSWEHSCSLKIHLLHETWDFPILNLYFSSSPFVPGGLVPKAWWVGLFFGWESLLEAHLGSSKL